MNTHLSNKSFINKSWGTTTNLGHSMTHCINLGDDCGEEFVAWICRENLSKANQSFLKTFALHWSKSHKHKILITFFRFDFDGSFPIVSSSIVSSKLSHKQQKIHFSFELWNEKKNIFLLCVRFEKYFNFCNFLL